MTGTLPRGMGSPGQTGEGRRGRGEGEGEDKDRTSRKRQVLAEKEGRQPLEGAGGSGSG